MWHRAGAQLRQRARARGAQQRLCGGEAGEAVSWPEFAPFLRKERAEGLESDVWLNVGTEELAMRPPERLAKAEPFFAYLWPGGYGVARYLEESSRQNARHSWVARCGGRYVDLGCGSGVCGITALVAGLATHVWAADADALAVKAAGMNAAASGLDPGAVMTGWQGDAVAQLSDGWFRGGGVVVAGDMLYEEEMATQVLAQCAEWRGASAGREVLLGDPGRTRGLRGAVGTGPVRVAAARGLSVALECVGAYALPPGLRALHPGLVESRVWRLVS